MKKQTAFDKARDQSAADGGDGYPPGYSPPQMCKAQGCPNRWSVDSSDKGIHKLCTAHAQAFADPNRWPEITQQQQWDETERARLRGEPKPYVPPLTWADKAAILQRLRVVAATAFKKLPRAEEESEA